jgi:hypothetical protein
MTDKQDDILWIENYSLIMNMIYVCPYYARDIKLMEDSKTTSRGGVSVSAKEARRILLKMVANSIDESNLRGLLKVSFSMLFDKAYPEEKGE